MGGDYMGDPFGGGLTMPDDVSLRQLRADQAHGWECPICHRVWSPAVVECPGPHPRKHEELSK